MSNLKCMSNQSVIPDSTDLNDWKVIGYYAVGTNRHNCKNIPTSVSNLIFYLIVFRMYYTYQVLLSGDSKIHIRIFNEDNKTWTPWT